MAIKIITNDDDWVIIEKDGERSYSGHGGFYGTALKDLIESVTDREVEYQVVSQEEIEQLG